LRDVLNHTPAKITRTEPAPCKVGQRRALPRFVTSGSKCYWCIALMYIDPDVY
jgi:hypothetical protein